MPQKGLTGFAFGILIIAIAPAMLMLFTQKRYKLDMLRSIPGGIDNQESIERVVDYLVLVDAQLRILEIYLLYLSVVVTGFMFLYLVIAANRE